jgi:hypothetical protein
MLKKENMTAICRPGALSLSSVPKTIADAMSLVLNMGEHFLWVGSLCIVQDDIKDKRTQIPQMASIFRAGYSPSLPVMEIMPTPVFLAFQAHVET